MFTVKQMDKKKKRKNTTSQMRIRIRQAFTLTAIKTPNTHTKME